MAERASLPVDGCIWLVHIAIKVDDLEKATKFYEDVFGFHQTGTGYARGHISRRLTDGNIDLALMIYDGGDVEEAQLSAPVRASTIGASNLGIATAMSRKSRPTAVRSFPSPARAR
jgi:catechol 2,3-dioxygenase-like lactoylglutathione lyase family enzyme